MPLIPVQGTPPRVALVHDFLLDLRGAPFDAVGRLDFGTMGLIIVGAFVVTWGAAFSVYRLRRVEERWSALVDRRELG